ncbi:hypothetical protein [Paraliomyxa miuraensis]|uniref:hypothetical protein n=1 Tax=Paraliomyxa miuraensis TaxID=376150 RepID=UPI0022575B3F|nr:hypothetical protein [Paraliomyxa miuraensis]MCX4242818.1 hypothetical protein [Paraliomyxa miuraensis]
MNPARPLVLTRIPPALPERFNWLESMLFAPRPTEARRAAERYVGLLLSRPAPPPRLAPTLPELVWSTAADS